MQTTPSDPVEDAEATVAPAPRSPTHGSRFTSDLSWFLGGQWLPRVDEIEPASFIENVEIEVLDTKFILPRFRSSVPDGQFLKPAYTYATEADIPELVRTRRDVRHEHKWIVHSKGESRILYENTSQLLPKQHFKAGKRRCEKVVKEAVSLWEAETQFAVFVVAQSDQYRELSAVEIEKELDEQIERLSRLNTTKRGKRHLPDDIELGVTATHVGLRYDGTTRPHIHLLFAFKGDSHEPIERIESALTDAGLNVQRGGPGQAPHMIGDRDELTRTVEYFFNYPISVYPPAGKQTLIALESEIRSCDPTFLPAFLGLVSDTEGSMRTTTRLYGPFTDRSESSSRIKEGGGIDCVPAKYREPKEPKEVPVTDHPVLLHKCQVPDFKYPEVMVTLAIVQWNRPEPKTLKEMVTSVREAVEQRDKELANIWASERAQLLELTMKDTTDEASSKAA